MMVPESSTKHPPAPPVAELAINGMSCANCARHVTEAIQTVPGVQSASVNLDSQQAVVRWSPDANVSVSAVIHAVETAGYAAKIVERAVPHAHGDCCGSHEPYHHSHSPGDTIAKPSSAAKFFCPMCLGVESDAPGDCPKCGMALERNP